MEVNKTKLAVFDQHHSKQIFSCSFTLKVLNDCVDVETVLIAIIVVVRRTM